jgi:hypothetical protein
MNTTTQPDCLSVDIVERKLSDKSTSYSVAIREMGAMPFVEMDARDQRCAIELRMAILVAVRNFTNIELRPA